MLMRVGVLVVEQHVYDTPHNVKGLSLYTLTFALSSSSMQRVPNTNATSTRKTVVTSVCECARASLGLVSAMCWSMRHCWWMWRLQTCVCTMQVLVSVALVDAQMRLSCTRTHSNMHSRAHAFVDVLWC